MAKCDKGYLCEVCGAEVPEITESDLYLRFVLGEVPLRDLTRAPERHIRCNPVQAQFIVNANFQPVVLEGPFDKRHLDPADVQKRQTLVTKGWLRLQGLAGSGLPLSEYPLDEIRRQAGGHSL